MAYLFVPLARAAYNRAKQSLPYLSVLGNVAKNHRKMKEQHPHVTIVTGRQRTHTELKHANRFIVTSFGLFNCQLIDL
jgi:hypothetical protein